jgi:competence protein ComEC
VTSPRSDAAVGGHGLDARQFRASVGDGWIVATACAAAAGAFLELSTSWVPLTVLVLVAARWPRLSFLMFVALFVGVLANRSLDGLNAELPSTIDSRVELVGDPEWIGSAVRVDVRADGRRFESWSRGAGARVVSDLASGESMVVSGDVERFATAWKSRRARHIAGRLEVTSVGRTMSASGPVGLANRIRRLVFDGAGSLSDRDRVLLTGFAVGDDRQQLPEVADDFRAAGLTHLTAVSGQNVAFVLLLIRPLLYRLGPAGRLAVVVAVLVQFGLITRWEPSVMRAIAMAIAAAATQLGASRRSGLPLLAGVVTLLLVIDPMLVHSIGFRMSVFASLGIATLSQPLARRLRGPAWVCDPLALTIAAQVGVSPILLATFGTMPLVSIPANLVAGPASGPLMAWGLTAGPLAGILGGTAAAALHLPTRLMTGYVAFIARVASELDGPDIDVPKALILVTAAACVWLLRARMLRALLSTGVVVIALWPVSATFDVTGADLYRSEGSTVLVVDRPSPTRLLAELRTSRIDHVDLLIVEGRSVSGLRAAEVVQKRVDVREKFGVDEIHGFGRQMTLFVGPFRVVINPSGNRLDVEVERLALSSAD